MKKLEIIKNVFGGIGLLLLSFHLFTRDSNGQSLQFKNCIRYSSYTFMLIFEGKPSAEERQILRRNGFKWAPSASAWQRQLNQQAIAAAGRIDFIRPLSGEHPRDLQPKAKQSPGRDETVR